MMDQAKKARTANTDPPACIEYEDISTGQRKVSLSFRNRAHMEQWVEDIKSEGYVAGLANGTDAFKDRIKSIIKELT